jgi:hypothetical protein
MNDKFRISVKILFGVNSECAVSGWWLKACWRPTADLFKALFILLWHMELVTPCVKLFV